MVDKILLGKSEGTRPHVRPKIRWEDNIVTDLKVVNYEGAWKTLSQDSVFQSLGVLMSWRQRTFGFYNASELVYPQKYSCSDGH